MAKDWHGWRLVRAGQESTDALHIGPLPVRKGIALSVTSGNVTEPLTYFRNEEAAQRAMAVLDALMGMGSEEAR